METSNSHHRKIIVFIEILVSFFAMAIMLQRVKYGIDFTDESWYVAEPYAVAQMGMVPFVNNVTQTPGFTIPLALLFRLFVLLTNGTDGIVLFSRVIFVVFSFLIAVITVRIVNKHTTIKMPIIVIPVLAVSPCVYSLFDINYNTIGLIYFPLILAIVFSDFGGGKKQSLFYGIIAGILAVRATIGTPLIIAGLAVIFIYLCLIKKGNTIKGILIGCILSCLLIFGFVMIRFGEESLKMWFQMFFSQSYFEIEGKSSKRLNIISILLLAFSMIASLFGFFFASVLKKKNDKNTQMVFNAEPLATIIILVSVAISMFRRDPASKIIALLTWPLPLLLAIFSKTKKYISALVISLAYFSIFILASITDIYGINFSRGYWLVYPLILLLCIFLTTNESDYYSNCVLGRVFRISVLSALVLVGAYKIGCSYSFVYRDDSISSLSTVIEEGIWKGIRTTKTRAKSVIELENFLQSTTSSEDGILCLDWASFGYLMSNGEICSPTTLDASSYSYNTNDPNPYYDYFYGEKKVPTKIIYIDFGRDESLSIDNGAWSFNSFVRDYYVKSNEFENEIFYVKEYCVVDEEGAKKMVENNYLKDNHILEWSEAA